LEVFKWLAATGNVAPEEMTRTFNLGLGMCLVVSEAEKTYILDVSPSWLFPDQEMILSWRNCDIVIILLNICGHDTGLEKIYPH
jgi:hypothetical protein